MAKKTTTGQYTITDLSDIYELVLSKDNIIVACDEKKHQKIDPIQGLNISIKVQIKASSSTTYEDGWTIQVNNKDDFSKDPDNWGKWSGVDYKEEIIDSTYTFTLLNLLYGTDTTTGKEWTTDDVMEVNFKASKDKQTDLFGTVNITKAIDGEKGYNVSTVTLYRRDKSSQPKTYYEAVQTYGATEGGMLTYKFSTASITNTENLPKEVTQKIVDTDIEPYFLAASTKTYRKGKYAYFIYTKQLTGEYDFEGLTEYDPENPSADYDYKVGDSIDDFPSKVYDLGLMPYWDVNIPSTSKDALWITTTNAISKEDTVDIYPTVTPEGSLIPEEVWNKPTILSETGVNIYTVVVYKRFSNTYDEPETTTNPPIALFKFSDQSLTWTEGDDGWSATCPDYDGRPIYSSSATVSAAGSNGEDTIYPYEWETPKKYVRDGVSFTVLETLDTEKKEMALAEWKALQTNNYKVIEPGESVPEAKDAETWEEQFISGKLYYKRVNDVYSVLIEGTDYQAGDDIQAYITTHGNVYDPYYRWYGILNHESIKIGDSIGIQGTITDNNENGIICIAKVSSKNEYQLLGSEVKYGKVRTLAIDKLLYGESASSHWVETSTNLSHRNKSNSTDIKFTPSEITFNAKERVGNTTTPTDYTGNLYLEFLYNDGSSEWWRDTSTSTIKYITSSILQVGLEISSSTETYVVPLRAYLTNDKIAKLSSIRCTLKDMEFSELNSASISFDDYDVISDTVTNYAYSDSGAEPPESGWTSSIPTPYQENKYLWTRVTKSYTVSTPDVTYSVVHHPERSVALVASQNTYKGNSRGATDIQQTIVFTANLTGITGTCNYYWKVNSGTESVGTDTYTLTIPKDSTVASYDVAVRIHQDSTLGSSYYADETASLAVTMEKEAEDKCKFCGYGYPGNPSAGVAVPIMPAGGFIVGDAYLNSQNITSENLGTVPYVCISAYNSTTYDASKWTAVTKTNLSTYKDAVTLCAPTYLTIGAIAHDEDNNTAWHEYYKASFSKSEYADNLLDGTNGSIPYQNDVDSTTFLAGGNNRQVLIYNKTNEAPEWSDVAPRAVDLDGGSQGQIIYQSGSNSTEFLAAGTNSQILAYDGSNNKPVWSDTAPKATNIADGAATQIPYQSATNTTTFDSDFTYTSTSKTIKVNNYNVNNKATISYDNTLDAITFIFL